MKKFKGTRYARIGTSYRPSLDRLHEEIIARQMRIEKLYDELLKLYEGLI